MRKIYAVHLLLIGCLTSCASIESTLRLRDSEANFRAFEQAELMLFYDLANPAGMSKEAIDLAERAAAEKSGPVCAAPYTERLMGAIEHAASAMQDRSDRGPLQRLPSYIETLDDFYSDCIAPFGVVGYNYAKLPDGREMRLPALIRSLVGTVEQVQSARAQVATEQRANAATLAAIAMAMGAAMARYPGDYARNPSQVYVGPYQKSNGTFVQGHWRTVPNFTCIDNIGGCR